MPMAIGIGIGLSFAQNVPSKSVADILCEGIANKVLTAAIYDEAPITFAPLVIYELDGTLYIDGVLEEHLQTRGNRPPPVSRWEVSAFSAVSVTPTTFTVHPRLAPILKRYQNVRCIVSIV